MERVLVAVDVRHLIGQARSYVGAVEGLLRRILAAASNSNTLWAFSFFDSSLPPMASSSSIVALVGRLGLGSAWAAAGDVESFKPFRECLNKMLPLPSDDRGPARPIHIASALLHLLTHYPWDPLLVDDERSHEAAAAAAAWMRSRNTLLLLSSAHSPQHLHSLLSSSKPPTDTLEGSRIAALHSVLDKKCVHVCWMEPPGESNRFSDLLEASKSSNWSFTSVDTLLVAALVMPHRLLLPAVAQPSTFPRGDNTVPAELLVPVSRHRRFSCPVGLTFLHATSRQRCGLELDKCSRLRLTLAAVLPSHQLVWQQTSCSYLVHDGGHGGGQVQGLSGTRQELLRRLEHLPHRLGCRQRSDLGLMLFFLARRNAVAVIDVDITSRGGQQTRRWHGLLEPLTVYSATLRLLEPGDAPPTGGKLQAGDKTTCTRLLSGSWDEAWCWCLELLRCRQWMDPIFRESDYPRHVKAWMRQVDEITSPVVAAKETVENLDGQPMEQRAIKPSPSVSDERQHSLTVAVAAKHLRMPPDQVVQWSLSTVSMNVEQENLRLAAEQPMGRRTLSPRTKDNGERLPQHATTVDVASFYLSALGNTLTECVSSGVFDAKTLVVDTTHYLKFTCDGSSIHDKLKELLLWSPERLSSKYRESDHPPDHRTNEYILQIKLRLEMMALAAENKDGFLMEKETAELIEQVCDLLFDIQFALPQSMDGCLISFADQVIRSSYAKVIPGIVESIYSRMEFDGYSSEVKAAALSVEPEKDVVESPAIEQQQYERAKKAKMERDRALRMGHFSGLRQTRCVKVVKKPRVLPRPEVPREIDMVAETPHHKLHTSNSRAFDMPSPVTTRRSVL